MLHPSLSPVPPSLPPPSHLSALQGAYEKEMSTRLNQIKNEIEDKGHYNLTYEELAFGARLAWRNAPRCVNRIIWRQLEVCMYAHDGEGGVKV